MTPNLDLRMCFNSSEDTFPLPADIKQLYGPFGFPNPPDSGRPHVTSNFVMSLDGKASFRELKGRTGGNIVSRSSEDRWMMDFLRAHHDAQLMGAGTLREEPGQDNRNPDFGIDDERLSAYRQKSLGLGRPKIMILTGSGDVDLTLPVFSSPRVESWIISTSEGQKNLLLNLKALGHEGTIKIISAGQGTKVNLAEALQLLRQKYGIRTLLCEGGPSLYGQLLAGHMIDEDFRTLSFQVMGGSTQPGVVRPSAYGDVVFAPETAPWFNLISLHYARPYHAFLRLRYVGPRQF